MGNHESIHAIKAWSSVDVAKKVAKLLHIDPFVLMDYCDGEWILYIARKKSDEELSRLFNALEEDGIVAFNYLQQTALCFKLNQLKEQQQYQPVAANVNNHAIIVVDGESPYTQIMSVDGTRYAAGAGHNDGKPRASSSSSSSSSSNGKVHPLPLPPPLPSKDHKNNGNGNSSSSSLAGNGKNGKKRSASHFDDNEDEEEEEEEEDDDDDNDDENDDDYSDHPSARKQPLKKQKKLSEREKAINDTIAASTAYASSRRSSFPVQPSSSSSSSSSTLRSSSSSSSHKGDTLSRLGTHHNHHQDRQAPPRQGQHRSDDHDQDDVLSMKSTHEVIELSQEAEKRAEASGTRALKLEKKLEGYAKNGKTIADTVFEKVMGEGGTMEKNRRTRETYSGQVKKVMYNNTGMGKTQKEIPDGEGVWRVFDRASGRDTEVYRGQFQNGMCHGDSVWERHTTGETYAGEWTKDKWNGVGIYRKLVGKNTETYNGEFKNNQYYGRGVLRATGEPIEDGMWRNNALKEKNPHTVEKTKRR